MALIGIDIGNNNCKMAVREGGSMRLISARMPENMVRDGEVTTPETMAVFLKEVRESERVKDRDCALVLNPSQAFFRHVTLPPMTVSELMLNLPYEFRDFISENPDDFVYDYAVDELIDLSTPSILTVDPAGMMFAISAISSSVRVLE